MPAVALFKYDVTIRSDSDLSLTDAVAWTQRYIDDLQINASQHLFADLFDARTSAMYRIFSTIAKAAYGIGEDYFVLTATRDALADLLSRVEKLEGAGDGAGSNTGGAGEQSSDVPSFSGGLAISLEGL